MRVKFDGVIVLALGFAAANVHAVGELCCLDGAETFAYSAENPTAPFKPLPSDAEIEIAPCPVR